MTDYALIFLHLQFISAFILLKLKKDVKNDFINEKGQKILSYKSFYDNLESSFFHLGGGIFRGKNPHPPAKIFKV